MKPNHVRGRYRSGRGIADRLTPGTWFVLPQVKGQTLRPLIKRDAGTQGATP